MASTYSSDLKLELMATGENAGTWGDKTNTNLNLIQQAVAGFEQITLSSGGTVALTMSDGAISNARNLVIKFATATIAASTVCTIPDSIEKFYIFDCSGLTNANNLTIKTASGTGFSPTVAGAASSKIFAAYSDGTNLNEISLNTLGGTIATANLEAASVTTPIIADDAVTQAKIADDAVGADQLAANAVVTASITDANVTTDKIADDAVTADKLANTAVSAGSYTTADITVDAQGRITSAATGSAGGGGFEYKIIQNGPASGNIAAGSNSSKFQIFAAAGGGGGGYTGYLDNMNAGNGGSGGYGLYVVSVQGGTTYPYSIGGGGAGVNFGQFRGPGGSGSAGGNTNVGNFFTVNAGGGGPGNSGSTGSAGTSPGATVSLNGFRSFLGGNAVGSGGSKNNNPGQNSPYINPGPSSAGSGGFLTILEG